MTKLIPILEMNDAQINEQRDRLTALKNKIVHNLLLDHQKMSYHQVEGTRKRLQKIVKQLQTLDYVQSEI